MTPIRRQDWVELAVIGEGFQSFLGHGVHGERSGYSPHITASDCVALL